MNYTDIHTAVGPHDRIRFTNRFAKAIKAYREDMSNGQTIIGPWNIKEGQKQFMEAWGRRMITTIENVERVVEELPCYEVHMKGSEPGQEIQAKRTLQSRMEFRGPVGNVYLNRQNHLLRISGDISPAKIACVLNSMGVTRYGIQRVD